MGLSRRRRSRSLSQTAYCQANARRCVRQGGTGSELEGEGRAPLALERAPTATRQARRRHGRLSYRFLHPVPLYLESRRHSTAVPSPERYGKRYDVRLWLKSGPKNHRSTVAGYSCEVGATVARARGTVAALSNLVGCQANTSHTTAQDLDISLASTISRIPSAASATPSAAIRGPVPSKK